MSIRASATLATLYQQLAQSLSEPLDWFANAGKNWTLYQTALELSREPGLSLLDTAVVELATIPPGSLEERGSRYQNLLAGSTTQPLTIYESLALEGRIHGVATFRVWTLYRAVGLQINGGELPDHVSLELAFLSFLVEQEANAHSEKGLWRKARREFIKQHASKWMPDLARSIIHTDDPVYRPVGLLLKAIIQAETRPPRKKHKSNVRQLPQFVADKTCTLCSFCAQVCPVQAIIVHETFDETTLTILDEKCVSCDKCVNICPANVLQLAEASSESKIRCLYTSPREHCPGCGLPTVSKAELDAIAGQIGRPRWLDYCSDCRIIFLRELQ